MRHFWQGRSKAALVHWAIGLVIVLAAAAIFIDIAGDVWLKEGFTWDAPVMLFAYGWRSPWLDSFMVLLTQAGEAFVGIIVAVLAFCLWRQGRLPEAILIMVSVIGGVLIDFGLKALFARPRPNIIPPLVRPTTYSFPSGHTFAAVSLYGVMAVLFWRRQRYGWAVFSSLWIPAIAFSRIYLGAHYPSDVVGSITVGIVWVAVVLVVYGRLYPVHRL